MYTHMYRYRIVRWVACIGLMVGVVELGTADARSQVKWAQESPTARPEARSQFGMTYDEMRQRVMLFGGGAYQFNDTWEWDGQQWDKCKPMTSPSARSYHCVVYDAARQRVVLFGGMNGFFSFLGDTWEWDGTNWTQCHPTTSPTARAKYGVAYDAVRQRVVLFGGWMFLQFLNDTWEWDGQNWKQCFPKTSPTARWDCAMVYDEARQRVVMYGGETASASPLGDTWEWDGIDWIARNPASCPPPRKDHALAWDDARQRVVLYGGRDSINVRSDTWEWDGKNWITRSTTVVPPARDGHSMVYDPIQGTTILFGGIDGTLAPMNDTWEYSPTDLIASTHRISVATGGSIQFGLDPGTALAGKFYWLLGCLDGTGTRGIVAGHVTLLLNPDPYFWFTAQYPNPLISNSLGRLDSAGKATAMLFVPKGLPASIIGTRFFHAYVAFESRIDYASTPVPLMLIP